MNILHEITLFKNHNAPVKNVIMALQTVSMRNSCDEYNGILLRQNIFVLEFKVFRQQTLLWNSGNYD